MHGVLPRPVGNTSWHEYLTALPEDDGLLATYVLMESLTLSRMVYTRQTLLALSNVSYLLVCESQFDDTTYADCQALWRQLMHSGFSVSVEESGTLGTAAAYSCPNAPNNSAVQRHSAASRSNATQGRDRLARLRVLDMKYLNGSLQKYEDALPCEPSARYTLPAGDANV